MEMEPIPFVELQHLEDSINFCWFTQSVIYEVQNNRYEDRDIAEIPENTDDLRQYTIDPTTRERHRLMLYQVVFTRWGIGVVIETKDLYIMGPDRRDLHRIILDQYAIVHLTGLRVFNKRHVSVKNYVWI
ncbi:hypothetical protein GCK32_011669 [Trichostrongylus colubriformis]|uniref:Uncharacterized protein n=1 Tax=Trichostrongylus colubriformis TaxID=6319 RepID=A0AAN8FG94_TRICO